MACVGHNYIKHASVDSVSNAVTTGTVEELPVSWTVQRDGEYSVEFRPLEEGEYEIEVTAERNGEALGSDKTYLYTAPSADEYFSA